MFDAGKTRMIALPL